MNAFITSPALLRPPTNPRSQRTAHKKPRRCAVPHAGLQQPQESTRPGFARADDDPATATQTSFLDPRPDNPQTPNDRVLQQVRDTISRLGVDEPVAQPRPFSPIDVSRVNPLSAAAGSVGAAAISYAAWIVLGLTARFFATHPLSDEVYVVQRLGAVVRTVLVCLFALGSGISGVTSLGLLMLSVRTAYGQLTGEFRD